MCRPIHDDLTVFDVQDEIPADYVIGVMMTVNALQQIKANKAVEPGQPDNVPTWVLGDNASRPYTCTPFNFALFSVPRGTYQVPDMF